MTRIAIFASGGGSNAEAIINHFKDVDSITVSLIVTNKSDAGIIKRANNHGIPFLVITKSELKNQDFLLTKLKGDKIDFIVLAGFLLLIPSYLVEAYPQKIVNIHPALLPAYGGKGMYGMNVHRAVKENEEEMSGMTIHYVNQAYDEGKHIFQASIKIDATDTAEEIAGKVLKLEHKYYSKVIDYLLKS